MAITQQFINKLRVERLKGLVDFDISFEGSYVTAILGPNGNGKSTVLHALAAAFQPERAGEDYKFSNFFLPSPDALWQGSHLTITHEFREGQIHCANQEQEYIKRRDRWAPKYVRRPFREIYYIGVDKCVPLIESEKKSVRVNYATTVAADDNIAAILSKASYVLNRQYVGLNSHAVNRGKTFIGVEVGDLKYSALSMSAGEQKVFYILDRLFRAGNNSLILIDELDLLLHDLALKRLIEVIVERATSKRIQVVFTTHRESVVAMSQLVNIRHIITRPGKSLCFEDTKPDAINRLTGEKIRLLEIFVEDDLAKALVSHIAGQLGLTKYLTITLYGAAINCFTAVCGLILGGDECSNSLFVIDGDVYVSEEDKVERIRCIIVGDDARVVPKRALALSKVTQFNLPHQSRPEPYIYRQLLGVAQVHSEEVNEILREAHQLPVVDDSHSYVNDIINSLGVERAVGLARVVDAFAKSDAWNDYVAPIHDWLVSKLESVREQEPVNVVEINRL